MIEPYNEEVSLGPIYQFIYSFHIPPFILIASYFSKKIEGENYKKRVISNLVIPYLIFETFYSIFDYFLFDKEKLHFSYFTPHWVMLFLFAMILRKISLPYIENNKFVLPACIILSVMAGYAQDVHYYASISRIIYFLSFFLMGYYCKKEWIRKLDRTSIKIVSLIVLIACFVTLYNCIDIIHTEWFYGALPYKELGYDEWYAGLYRVLSYIFSAIFGVCILALIPSKNIPLITNWNKNTTYVYLIHGYLVRYLLHIEYYNYLRVI